MAASDTQMTRVAVVRARTELGFTYRRISELTGVPLATIHSLVSQRSVDVAHKTLERIKRGLPPEIFQPPAQPAASAGPPIRRVAVTDEAHAGIWRDNATPLTAELQALPWPRRPSERAQSRPAQAIYLADDHADQLFSPNSYLFLRAWHPNLPLRLGAVLLVTQTRRGRRQNTLRQVVESPCAGGAALAFMSNRRDLPAEVPVLLDQPYQPQRVGSALLELRGRVIGWFGFEPMLDLQ